MTWRDQIRPIVDRIIRENKPLGEKVLKRALIDQRPSWVSGAVHMTRIWRSEVKIQLGKRSPLYGRKRVDPDPNQLDLFQNEKRD